MPPKTRIFPFKLEATKGPLSRDDLSTWEYNQMSFCRQNEAWQAFLPDGDRATWTSFDDDKTYGLIALKADLETTDPVETKKLRAAFKDFLNCMSVHCPTNFTKTVQREATSWSWIIKLIKDNYNLNTKGEQFLGGNDIKLEFDDNFTYQQGFMYIRDFYISSLPQEGTFFKTKALAADDRISPLTELFIVEKWLSKINPRLPAHVQNTRGHLFTEARPTLACNQRILCDQIDVMLSEIDGANGVSAGSVSAAAAAVNVGFVPSRRGGGGGFAGSQFPLQRGLRNFRGQGRGSTGPRQTRPAMAPFNCHYCLEARRYDASITHPSNKCHLMFPRHQSRPQLRQPGPGFKVLLVPNQPITQTPNQGKPTSDQEQQSAIISQLQTLSMDAQSTAYAEQFQYPEYRDHAYQTLADEDQYGGAVGGYSAYPAGSLEEL